MKLKELEHLKESIYCLYESADGTLRLCFLHVRENSILLEEGVLGLGIRKEILFDDIECINSIYYIGKKDEQSPYIIPLELSFKR